MLSGQGGVRIAVMVSGGGTNLQALIDAQNRGDLANGRIVKVISNKSNAFALERAKAAGISTAVVERKNYDTSEEFENALLSALQNCGAELIVLAGFLCILGEKIITQYRNKIINVHPSLIPSFCGKGYYGLKVHEEVLKKGVKVTGATVHFVNEIPDGGDIILQKAVKVSIKDTPETLQNKVMMQAEWVLLPKAVSLFCQGKLHNK